MEEILEQLNKLKEVAEQKKEIENLIKDRNTLNDKINEISLKTIEKSDGDVTKDIDLQEINNMKKQVNEIQKQINEKGTEQRGKFEAAKDKAIEAIEKEEATYKTLEEIEDLNAKKESIGKSQKEEIEAAKIKIEKEYESKIENYKKEIAKLEEQRENIDNDSSYEELYRKNEEINEKIKVQDNEIEKLRTDKEEKIGTESAKINRRYDLRKQQLEEKWGKYKAIEKSGTDAYKKYEDLEKLKNKISSYTYNNLSVEGIDELAVTTEEKDSEIKDHEVTNAEVKNPEVNKAELRNPEIKEPEIKYSGVKGTEIKNPEVKATEMKDPEVKATEVKDSEEKDPEVKDTEMKDSEVKDTEMKDSEVKDTEMKDSEVKDTEMKDPEVKDSEVKETEETAVAKVSRWQKLRNAVKSFWNEKILRKAKQEEQEANKEEKRGYGYQDQIASQYKAGLDYIKESRQDEIFKKLQDRIKVNNEGNKIENQANKKLESLEEQKEQEEEKER